MTATAPTPTDLDTVTQQLGRPVRGVRAIAARCGSDGAGHPSVVETQPRLPDGTPFPTLYYLTCPRAVAATSALESGGVMREWTDELADDADLAAAYRAAHESYLARREAIAHVEEIAGVTAGGMPDRVKCLHVLVAHSLAAGPGVNPFGDRALELMTPTWTPATCDWSPV
ncbi:DUF501 domain-containing protein [Jiangella aurantiaca]|uniref:DUF501 domain-containing protein n=1 Tax=Jiangella aurantiaca TaxID=2530373 RepID=A0A4R5AHS2_9ACTN|nr:DUF501 domain-containing protein [Jiangella aurantiaca]TDD71000.1 DUF501 domain-containing protein [Jiangella aurantiaca]